MSIQETISDSLERARAYLSLNVKGHMGLLKEIQQNWFLYELVKPGEIVYTRIKQKCLVQFSHMIRVKVYEHEMYVIMNQQKDYMEIYYPNFMLCLVSAYNYTALDNGTSMGIQLPSYLSIESTGDYFNYTVQNRVLEVPYEFFEILRNLHTMMNSI